MKPTGIRTVVFYYTCPSCKEEHDFNYQEIDAQRGALCWCGRKIKFDRMGKIDVNIGKIKSVRKTKQIKTAMTVNQMQSDVISGLVGLGNKRSVANSIVIKLCKAKVYNNEESLLQDALARM